MNTKHYIIVFSVLLFSFTAFAQSDYEIVQDFKSKIGQLEQRLLDAATMEEVNTIAKDIELLKSQFEEHKDLLDKSLYPDDFNKAFAKLKTDFDVRVTDVTQIEVLSTELTVIKEEVDRLNSRNQELINRIAIVEASKEKDVETIRRLENLIADLKSSLLERDILILSIVDSLTPQLTADVSSLTAEDKQRISSEFEKNFVLVNVKRSLRDHVRFLDVTSLKPSDIKEIRRQQDEFVGTWQKIGVNLIEVYADKPDKSNELQEIDALFISWQEAVKSEAWNSIKEEFAMNGIYLLDFNSGQEFTVEVTRFIDEELKNYNIKSKEQSERVYTIFADSTWYKSIQADWLPYLTDNKMITPQQKQLMETKVSEWKSVVFPRDISWVYYVIAALLIGALVFFFLRRKPKTVPEKQVS